VSILVLSLFVYMHRPARKQNKQVLPVNVRVTRRDLSHSICSVSMTSWLTSRSLIVLEPASPRTLKALYSAMYLPVFLENSSKKGEVKGE